jgi:hypothetical protein
MASAAPGKGGDSNQPPWLGEKADDESVPGVCKYKGCNRPVGLRAGPKCNACKARLGRQKIKTAQALLGMAQGQSSKNAGK